MYAMRMFGLSRDQLKYIAFFCMVCDHVACLFLSSDMLAYQILRFWIGRIAYPLFAVLFAEGFFYTRNKLVHIRDLLLFGLLSEPFFDYVTGSRHLWVDFEQQNVLWSFALCFLLLCLLDRIFQAWTENVLESRMEQGLLSVGLIAVFAWCAWKLRLDYQAIGALCVVVVYFLLRTEPTLPLYYPGFLVAVTVSVASMTPGALFVPLLLLFYRKKNGRPTMRWKKYGFYLAYPGHLALLAFLSLLFF